MNKHKLFSIFVLCFLFGILHVIGFCNPISDGYPSASLNGNSYTSPNKLLEVVKTEPHFLILRFRLPKLEIQKLQQDEESFTHIHFKGAYWTSEIGKPKLPIYSVQVGLPSASSVTATVLQKQSTFKQIDRPLINNQAVDPFFPDAHQRDDLISESAVSAGNITTTLYPTEMVEVIPVGYVRSQRIGVLHIHPIQYNSSTKQIKITNDITFRIDFFGASTNAPPPLSSHSIESTAYEDMFQTMLINNTQAYSWRHRLDRLHSYPIQAAPAAAATRRRFKISITRNDMYRISYTNLTAAGVTPENIDLDSVLIDLDSTPVEENSRKQGYYIFDRNLNETFDQEDMIVFYARSISNKFTDTNVYWLSFSEKGTSAQNVGNTRRIGTRSAAPVSDGISPPFAFKTKLRFEEDVHHDALDGDDIKSELADHYFWTGLRGDRSDISKKPFPVVLPNTVPRFDIINRDAIIRVRLQGSYRRSAAVHNAQISFNGEKLGGLASWRRQEAPVVTRNFPQNKIHHNNLNELVIEALDNNNTPRGSFDFYLDWYEFEYWRDFRAESNRLEFNSDTEPIIDGKTHYEVINFSSDAIDVYALSRSTGITSKLIDGRISRINNTYQILFEDDVSGREGYYAIANNAYSSIGRLTEVPPSTLRNATMQADYIVITHNTFLESITPLVEFRRSQDLTVKVVDIDDIYNEFSSGLFSPFAIQHFLRYAYHTWQPPAPTYVLLVGDAHYDYKEVIVKHNRNYDLYPNFVPTYHGWSPESGETAMDQRFVNVSGEDHLPDMFIGRLSVQSTDHLDTMVKKIINYETKPKIGLWQATLVQVSDDHSDNPSDDVFERTRNKLIKDFIPVAFDTKQIYLRQIERPDLTHHAILQALDEGTLVIEYAGHGGNQTWADEGIFRLQDVVDLRNKYLPFVVTTTCLNGEFDKPQEYDRHSLSEQFLLGEYGAIATLSATRLTYAQANAEFDEDLFTAMFVREPFEAKQGAVEIGATPPSIGKIVNDAKIRFLTRIGNRRWIPGTEQYVLIGDPATRLALPTLDFMVNLQEFALNSEKQIVVPNNEVGTYDTNGAWWKADGFSANRLVASAVFQNEFDTIYGNEFTLRSTSRVWKGDFETIRLDVPPKALPGRGVVRLFAHDNKRTAIGGAVFWVDTPIIGDVRDELDVIDTHTLNIQALIYDDQGGDKGIRSIIVHADNTATYTDVLTPMVKISPPSGTSGLKPDGQWYGIETPIPLPVGVRQIRYRIVVTDTSGLEIAYPPKSEQQIKIDVPEGPNLQISTDGISIAPIRYTFDEKTDKYSLTAELINNGGRTVKTDIDVVFAEGNPDKDQNQIIDEDADILGTITVKPDDWQEGDTVLQRTTAKIKLDTSLTTGIHRIYVVADPDVDTEDENKIKGNVAEWNEFDNVLYVTFVVNEFFYSPTEPLTAFSLDRVFEIDLPASAASIEGDQVPLTISSSEPFGLTQPSLDYATIPRVAALRRGLLRTGDEYAQQYEVAFRTSDVTLKKPASLKLRFDISSLEDIVRENTPWQEGSKDFKAAMIEEAEKLSIYTWQSSYEKWKRLPSQVGYVNGIEKPQPDDEGPIFQLENYITPIQTENANKQPLPLEDIKINPQLTPAGIWVILFLDPTQYVVYLKRKHHVEYEKFAEHGELDYPYRIENYGLEFTIPKNWEIPPELADGTPIVPFEFGDIVIFETDYVEANAVLKGTRNQNAGNGTATITPKIGANKEFALGDWFIFFTSKQYYEIRDNTGAQVYSSSNQPVPGEVNKSFYHSHLGFEILVSSSTEEFQFGDKIKFSTAQVATITAETTELSPVTLLSSDDVSPPTFNMWIDGVQPKTGSVIAPRPLISILLEDADGVDLDTLIVRRGDNGSPLKPIFDYILRNPKNVNSVPIDYKPIFFPGEYAFEIEASDFNGNAIGGKEGKIQTRFVVIEMPDITPPIIEILVNDEILIGDDSNSLGAEANMDKNRITEQPHCEIRVTDDTALDNTLLNITFNQISADGAVSDTIRRYREFDEAKWEFDEKDPLSANFSFAPDLPNGTYRLQVTATDTSENTAEIDTIFTLDEKVNLSNVFNVPNPMENGRTFFTYHLLQPPDKVTIKIYTVSGRLIKTISDASADRGDNETFWDGRDETGVRCANGVYLYRVVAQTENGSVEKIGKLAILR